MEQGYGGLYGRPSARWGGRCCLGTPCRGLRAGAYARMRLPQLGRAERRPQHARAAHWTAAPSLSRRCMGIGRLCLRKAGGAWRATAAAGFGGRLGRPGPFLPLSPGRADRTARGPAFLSEDATKWRRQGAESRSALVGRGVLFPPLPVVSRYLWGLAEASGWRGVVLFPASTAVQCCGAQLLARVGLGGSDAGYFLVECCKPDVP